MDDIFSKSRIQATQLFEDSVTYFRQKYNQALAMFSYSTGYGQILLTVQNISSFIFFYIQDIATEDNILQARRNSSIYGKARLTGHNPSRGRSAIGEIMLQRISTNTTTPGDVIYLTNHMRIKCAENGLTYLIELNNDDLSINTKSTQQIRLKIIEGIFDYEIATGTGEDLQSFEIAMPPGQMIDDDKIIITINGQQVSKYDTIYDMEYGKYGCMVKTGYTSGIDVFFGKGIATNVPPLGSQIRTDYLVTNGSAGNFMEKDTITMSFMDTGFDMNGQDVDLNKIFTIIVSLPPQFGTDLEDPKLTKLLAPYVSRNMIIHDDKSINYHFAKFNYFSSVKVYRDDINDLNNFKVILVPNIANRMNSTEDYFSCDLSKFILTDGENARLVSSIDESGSKSTNINISIINPIIRKYVMHIFMDVFSVWNGKTTSESDIRKQLKTLINSYLLNQRTNHSRIIASDLIKTISGISQIAAIKIIFVSEQNESFILASGDDNQNLGMDNLGNILTADNEIPLLRGGWSDRDGVSYIDQYDELSTNMQSINVFIKLIN